ncbi:hypothetical protein MAPG_00500 [Magnaporthiopsis poae ATCC 64411]|uniref:F-box domain-containing protein n=1 Tax=Magnaporthiopsis poae (strain ATCC 64411 / 73-15) TaxID=644358 RepID=A0A0C4DL61_MAGP6|nr:hypothetical protein MAPG_00500 [Magnaporthiopsis poae ATCC 64411]
MGAPEEAGPARAVTGEPLTFLGLPREVQKAIIAQCEQVELVCLSLVSKHFRDLAAAQLYRNFNIVFPDDEEQGYDSPVDGLSGGFDAFVTSDYDYTRHLREISLDTQTTGDKAEILYKPYQFHLSCGKFMNTLLLLTLRKSKSLESFRWNIRVELSRPVYKALHEIETLKDVHIRFQVGRSLYVPPPPLPHKTESPKSGSTQSNTHPPNAGTGGGSQMPAFGGQPPLQTIYNATSLTPVTAMTSSGLPASVAKSSSRAVTNNTEFVQGPPTLSGFKKLRSLAVLDMDTLDAVEEIQACIRNSSSTLTTLKLSFSEHLASQARKPPPEAELDDSDPDDEFQVVPGPPHPLPYVDNNLSLPVRLDPVETRKSQEAVLGKIFDVEALLAKKPPRRACSKDQDKKKETSDTKQPQGQPATPDHAKEFFTKIAEVSSRLNDLQLGQPGGPTDARVKQQEILDLIVSATRRYVASVEGKPSTEGASLPVVGPIDIPGCGRTQGQISAGSSSAAEGCSAEKTIAVPESHISGASSSKDQDPKPEDVNIEEPEGQLVLDAQDDPNTSPPAETTVPDGEILETAGSADVPQQAEQCPSGGGAPEVHKETGSSHAQLQKAGRHVGENGIAVTGKRAIPAVPPGETTTNSQNDGRIREYIRATRGIGLTSLNVYLVPVKASVLSKAIDLRVLRNITLLNVGPQQPIWALFSKENKLQPLPLRSIFTDNVSSALLNFVSGLQELREFLIMERDHKYKPESFAAKTTTTIDQIRRLVLKKHLPTLKRLMIKNMDSMDWDIDEHTIGLICRKGKALEELAISMNIRAIHALMQNMGGLANLLALHVIHLRNEDTCVWVMRETKKFLIDNLSHHRHMKLEWISIDDDDRLERIVRSTDKSKKDKDGKGKGKEQPTGNGLFGSHGHGPAFNNTHYDDTFPLSTTPEWPDAGDESCSEDDSDDYDEDDDGTKRPRMTLSTEEGTRFFDITGVRIFEKDVVSGRL